METLDIQNSGPCAGWPLKSSREGERTIDPPHIRRLSTPRCVRMSLSSSQTSLKVFRAHLQRNPDGTINADGVVSKECLEAWVKTRHSLSGGPLKPFRRALTHHLTGVDGRVPFTREEEEAILKVARDRASWANLERECGGHRKQSYLLGFRSKGFHEKLRSGSEASFEGGGADGSQKKKKRAKVALAEQLKRQRQIENNEAEDTEGDQEEPNQQASSSRNVAWPSVAPQPHNLYTGEAARPNGSFDMQYMCALMNDPMLAYSSAYQMNRLLVLSNGTYVRPNIHNVQELLSRFEQFPHHVLLICCPISSLNQGGILAQNHASVETIGNVVAPGNSARLFLMPTALAAIMAAFGQLVMKPSEEFSFPLDVLVVDGTTQPCQVLGIYHPQFRLIALRFLFLRNQSPS